MIAAVDVGLLRSGRTVLRGVCLDLVPGEMLALLGPNGAGKSTLLHVLAGELQPTSGSVRFCGERLDRLPPRDLARRRAWMGQGLPAPIGLTAAELVALGRQPHGTKGAHRLARFALRELGALELWDRRADQLSGGELQRVHLARALVQVDGALEQAGREGSAALLLDEPTASLDPAHASLALAAANARARAGAAVVLVLHDLSLASQWCDRIALLAHGAIHALGAPFEVLTEANLAFAYGARLRTTFDPDTGRPMVLPPVAAPAAVP